MKYILLSSLIILSACETTRHALVSEEENIWVTQITGGGSETLFYCEANKSKNTPGASPKCYEAEHLLRSGKVKTVLIDRDGRNNNVPNTTPAPL